MKYEPLTEAERTAARNEFEKLDNMAAKAYVPVINTYQVHRPMLNRRLMRRLERLDLRTLIAISETYEMHFRSQVTHQLVQNRIDQLIVQITGEQELRQLQAFFKTTNGDYRTGNVIRQQLERLGYEAPSKPFVNRFY